MQLVPVHPTEALSQLLKQRKDGEEISRTIVPPQDADTVAYVTVRMMSTGALRIDGHILDKRMALQLLDHAREVIASRPDPAQQVVVPSRDVDVTPSEAIPLKPYGDMLPHERGDG
jgi:hypothetical protein